MERAANGLMVVLILIQLITGFVALRKITQHQEKIIKKIFTICSKF
jgi:hypothetical protein